MDRTPSPERRRLLVAAVCAVALAALAVYALYGAAGRGAEPVPGGSDPAPAGTMPEPAARAAERDAAPRAAEHASPGRQAASAGAALHGTVHDRSGRPQAGVVVALNGPGDADHEVATAPDGSFTATLRVPGSYQVVARGAGILTHAEFLRVEDAAGEIGIALVVDAGWPVAGEVLDASGRPVAGARVTPWRQGPSGSELDPRASTTSDAGGRFELRGHADGITFALVECEGFSPRKVRLEPRRAARIVLRAKR